MESEGDSLTVVATTFETVFINYSSKTCFEGNYFP